MRTILALAVLAALLFAALPSAGVALAPGRALAEEPADPLGQLQKDVDYLKKREAALSTYVERNAVRADEIDKLVAELRTLGFAAAANPAPARERLLRGLTQLAASLRADLPKR